MISARRSAATASPRTKVLIALLSIAGVLAWQLTMSAMSHAGTEALIGTPPHSHSATHPVGMGSDSGATAMESLAVVAMWASGGAVDDIACTLMGIGCILAVLSVVIGLMLVARSAIGRAIRIRLVRAMSAVVQRLPQPPSLIVLSISRT